MGNIPKTKIPDDVIENSGILKCAPSDGGKYLVSGSSFIEFDPSTVVTDIATTDKAGIVMPDGATIDVSESGVLSVIPQMVDALGKSNIKLVVNPAYVDNLSFPESTIVRDVKIPAIIGINKQITIDNPFGKNTPVLCILEIFAEGKWGRPGCYHSASGNYAASCECSLGTGLYISTGSSGLTAQIAAGTGLGISTSWATNIVSAPIRILVYKIGNETNVNSELEIFQSGMIKGSVNALDFDFTNVTVEDNKATISVDVQTNGHSSQPIGFTSVQPWTEKVVVSDAGVWLKLDGSPIDRYAYPEISNNFKILIPQTDIPVMTAATTGTYTASASVEYNSSYPAYNAFNGILALPSDAGTNAWLSAGGAINATTGVVNNQWLQITNTVPFKITGYGLDLFNTNNPPISWTFAGSNNGTTWTTLDTRTDVTPGKLFFTISIDAIAYNRYRITITKALINYTTVLYTSIPEMFLFTDKFKLANIPVNSNSWYTYVKVKEAPYNEKFRGVPGKDALSKHMAYKLIVSSTDTTTVGDFVVREPILPANVGVNSTYEFPNPFGNIPCICTVEVNINNIWHTVSGLYSTDFYGFTLNSNGPTFILVTGNSRLATVTKGAISPHVTNLITTAPCRIHCWAIQSTPVFPYIYTTLKMSSIGDWDTFNSTQVPEHWHERNGDLLTDCSVLYPDFMNYVIAHPELCCTEAEWQAYSIAASGTGGVPFYVLDIENDTVRLPDTRGDVIIHGSPPLWKTDAIRNIKGKFGSIGHVGFTSADLAYAIDGPFIKGSDVASVGSYSGNYKSGMMQMNTELVVPTDTTNHPRIVNQLGCVCLINVYLEPPRPNLGHIKEFLFEAPDIGYEEMDGRILSDISTIYPDFITWLNADINTDFLITEAQYQTYLIASSGIGGVPYFVYNKDNNTLRLPDMRNDSTYVSPTDKFGKFENDAIREITGSYTNSTLWGVIRTSGSEIVEGAFYKKGTHTGVNTYAAGTSSAGLGFKASLIVPTDDTNHPRRVGVKMCIYLGRKAIQPEGAN